MSTWIAWGHEHEPGSGRRTYYPVELTPAGSRPTSLASSSGPPFIPLQTFKVPTPQDADRHYKKLLNEGLARPQSPLDPPVEIGSTHIWRFRGFPSYLSKAADRLGLSVACADKAKFSAELYRIAVLLGQLSETYHGPGRKNFNLTPLDKSQISGTLRECERFVEILHCCAAGASAALDEAWRAHDLHPPRRSFEVMSDFDSGDEPDSIETTTESCNAGV